MWHTKYSPHGQAKEELSGACVNREMVADSLDADNVVRRSPPPSGCNPGV